MSRKNFFVEQEPHTATKTDIVVSYFQRWSKIMQSRCSSLTYLDLFSGPGKFEDGTLSTPVLILREATRSNVLKAKLNMHFYEGSAAHCSNLENVLISEPGYSEMRNKPIVHNETIDKELARKLPSGDCTFTFIDPCGYKGISLELLTEVVRCWGSDCIFFLSTSGILRNIERDEEHDRLVDIFGKPTLSRLRNKLAVTKDYWKKHILLLTAINVAMVQSSRRDIFFLPFGFEFEVRKQLSHFLVFVTKHHLGFGLMKDIMAEYGLRDSDEIPRYLSSSIRSVEDSQYALPLEKESPAMSKLKDRLQRDFCGRTLKVFQLVAECHGNKYYYTTNNIKDAVGRLESDGTVKVDIPAISRIKKNGKVTLGKSRKVTFTRYGKTNG